MSSIETLLSKKPHKYSESWSKSRILETHTCLQTSLVHTEQNFVAEHCYHPKFPLSPRCHCGGTEGQHSVSLFMLKPQVHLGYIQDVLSFFAFWKYLEA